MADKEVTVYIVDVGATMAECHGGRAESNLDWAMRYVYDKLCTTTAASRKTWLVGVLALRSDVTRNPQEDDDGYEKIELLQDVAPMSLTGLRALRASIYPRRNRTDGDAVSAIIVATAMIERAAPKRLKYRRRIVVVTDGMGAIDGDDFDDVAAKINDLGIELVVVGADFDDGDYTEPGKHRLKARSEQQLRALTKKCHAGVFGTLADAVAELDTPGVKETRPYKTYDGPLTLGPPECCVSIHVERYFMTKQARPPPATTVVVRDDAKGDSDKGDSLDTSLVGVKNTRTYTVDDPTAPGGKREVALESLDKGYEYGRTAVAIGATDSNVTQLETEKDFSLLGFVARDHVAPFLAMGESCAIVPQLLHDADELAFHALVQAMDETQSCAVARLVAKEGKEPQLLLLSATVNAAGVHLYDVPLPFAEDVRPFRFPPLDRVVTASGAVLTEHRLLPNADLCAAMSSYVDAMDLSFAGTDDDGQPAEYAHPQDTFSPIISRVSKAIAFRALNPTLPYTVVDSASAMRYQHPPEHLVAQARPQIAALVQAAGVQKVPPKKKGLAGRKHANKPLSGLNVDALLGGPCIKEEGGALRTIPPDNAVPAYKQALESTVSVDQIAGFTDQLGRIIEDLVAQSLGDLNYARATETLRVMREELVDYEEPDLYNAFLKSLKGKIVANELGGPRLDFWYAVRTSGLGLVTSAEAEKSSVTPDEAQSFGYIS